MFKKLETLNKNHTIWKYKLKKNAFEVIVYLIQTAKHEFLKLLISFNKQKAYLITLSPYFQCNRCSLNVALSYVLLCNIQQQVFLFYNYKMLLLIIILQETLL